MKRILVFIILGIPIIIAVVLKFFGQNKYEIPIYYQDGVQNEACGLKLEKQYFLTELGNTSGDYNLNNHDIGLIFFDTPYNEFAAGTRQELQKIRLTKADKHLLIYSLGTGLDSSRVEARVRSLVFSEEELEDIAVCDLLIPGSHQTVNEMFRFIVLVDNVSRIRGYFDSGDPKEFDRLSAEIDILKLEPEQE